MVEHNSRKLLLAARQMSKEQRQGLSTLLAKHLCSHPAQLNQLGWLPNKLRDRALEKLTFTIRRIGSVASSILDASWEDVAGCKFVGVNHLGTPNEQWIFQTPLGNRMPVFGTEAIEAIALAQGE